MTPSNAPPLIIRGGALLEVDMDGSVLGWLQKGSKIQGFGNFESLDFFSVRSVRRLPATFFIAHVKARGGRC